LAEAGCKGWIDATTSQFFVDPCILDGDGSGCVEGSNSLSAVP
jgi:hypothetical protein